MRPVVVASVQFDPVAGAVQANLQMALQYAFEAAVKGAKIVVLPELCVSGADLTERSAIQSSQVADGYQTNLFVPLCRRYNMLVVFGYPELSEGCLYNSAALVGPAGLIGNARKKCLEGFDFLWARPGDDTLSPVVVHEGIRVGALVSHDVRNARRESYAWSKFSGPFYRKGMVDLICVPCAWQEGTKFPDSRWVNLAEQVNCNVAISNQIFAPGGPGMTGGGSCIVDRNLKIWSYGSSLTAPAVVGGLVQS